MFLLKIRTIYLYLIALALLGGLRLAHAQSEIKGVGTPGTIPARPTGFAPSNTRTADGKLIPVEQFFPAARCARCHQDTHAAWSESLHRNAAREPFYRESADILLRTRGIEFTRHCESCHTPVALVSGALESKAAKQQAPFTALDDEGVTCSVCHSITEARLDGTGSYTIRRPALLADEDGTPRFGDFTDEQILADVPAHKRAVMRPLLKSPEFCATCHKVDAPPTLNGYKRIRGFSAYDEWQQSGLSQEAATPYYRKPMRLDCRACHMPKVESRNDRAAKQGVIASHQWLGANTAAPLFYGQTTQVANTVRFLENNVLSADIIMLKREATGEQIAPLSLNAPNNVNLQPGEEVTAEVVISNRAIGHSFAPEVRDLYEIWVEFIAQDSRGRTLLHSGFIRPDQMLDPAAHTYKAILLDSQSRPITRHQIWLTTAVAYNNAIPAGRSDIARYRFRVPESGGSINLQARVYYRRFNQEYTDYVLQRQKRELTLPVVQMAEARANLELNPNAKPQAMALDAATRAAVAKRWNDYGIGLMEQAQYGPASESFRRAAAWQPDNSDFLVNAAWAEMKTERFAPERTQFTKAATLLQAALQLEPASPRARYFLALVKRATGQAAQAADDLAKLAQEYPRDREVHRQLGQTLYTLGRFNEARAAMEAVTAVDPTDANAYQLLAPLYAVAGLEPEVGRARALYLQWREDPLAEGVAARFFAAHPEWSEERTGRPVYGFAAPLRPVLTGTYAAPVD